MTRRSLSLVAALSLPLLAACGDSSKSDKPAPTAGGYSAAGTSGPPAPSDSDASAVKARMLALFDVVKAGGGAKAAEFIVYKGSDEARRYKAAAKYEGDEAKQVDRAVKKLENHLDVGAPTFEKAETKSKGAEKWVAWTVRLGEGDKSKRALYAFINVGGTWLLGDIDEIREPAPTK